MFFRQQLVVLVIIFPLKEPLGLSYKKILIDAIARGKH